jgi:hypothetical protein
LVKTEQGKKFVVVDEYRRRGPGGKVITVHAHARSTPCAPTSQRSSGARGSARAAPPRAIRTSVRDAHVA